MTLPADIEQIFFDTLTGDKTVSEFEQWLYADKRLETILDSDDYLELISYGYKSDNAWKGLFRLLEKHIDKGKLETIQTNKLLTKALKRDEDLPQILMRFYDMYCKGYYFMDNLGLGYGLAVETARVENTTADTWDELTPEQQKKLLDSFYPHLEDEIKKVIFWLDTGKIILTGIKNELDHFQYIDNRTELEKQPTAYKAYGTINNTAKPWWKFW